MFVPAGSLQDSSVINQTLAEKVQDAIGGTIDEIVNEGGWKSSSFTPSASDLLSP